MNKIKYSLLIALLIFGCSSEVDYIQIQAGDTIEVTSQTFPGNNEGIVYAWGVPKSDDGDIPSFRIENNSMYFKAEETGKYYLSLSLETNGGEVIAKEEFYYDAIQTQQAAAADNSDSGKNIESSNEENSSDSKELADEVIPQEEQKEEKLELEEQADKKSEAEVTPRPSSYFTVQVYSRPEQSMALEDSTKLTHLGFSDVHLEQFTLNDTLFWRVRTGFFNTKIRANKHKNELSEVLKVNSKKLWSVEVK